MIICTGHRWNHSGRSDGTTLVTCGRRGANLRVRSTVRIAVTAPVTTPAAPFAGQLRRLRSTGPAVQDPAVRCLPTRCSRRRLVRGD